MTKVSMTESFASSIEKVWAVVTDRKNVSWRSDLRSVSTSLDGTVFVEVSKAGNKTQFRVLEEVNGVNYRLSMHNEHMTGTFYGEFYPQGEGCRVVLTEELEGKNPLINMGMKKFLEKHQRAYLADLRRALGE